MYPLLFISLLLATPALTHPSNIVKRDVDQSKVPPFLWAAGQNNNGLGSCLGYYGDEIPCDCPPNWGTFISALNLKVNEGLAWGNTDSCDDQWTRFVSSYKTLGNITGTSGFGCPLASTSWQAQVAIMDYECGTSHSL